MRVGAWCRCGRSCITSILGTGFEVGISDYECEPAGEGKWRPNGPSFEKRRQAPGGYQKNPCGPYKTCYLVKGVQIGTVTGSDTEPLLKDVRALKIVEWDGDGYFREVEDVKDFRYECHPGWPYCECDSWDDKARPPSPC